MARILAQKLTDDLGQQVIVENRSGGGGNTGSDFVAKAEADGYTLLFTAPGPLTVNQTLYSKLPFDPAKDFAPVGLFATAPIVLIVNPGVPANGVQELVALSKTPEPVLARLRDEVAKALEAPDMVARIRELGSEPGTAFGKDFGAFMAAETRKWAEVIRTSGAKAD